MFALKRFGYLFIAVALLGLVLLLPVAYFPWLSVGPLSVEYAFSVILQLLLALINQE